MNLKSHTNFTELFKISRFVLVSYTEIVSFLKTKFYFDSKTKIFSEYIYTKLKTKSTIYWLIIWFTTFINEDCLISVIEHM